MYLVTIVRMYEVRDTLDSERAKRFAQRYDEGNDDGKATLYAEFTDAMWVEKPSGD